MVENRINTWLYERQQEQLSAQKLEELLITEIQRNHELLNNCIASQAIELYNHETELLHQSSLSSNTITAQVIARRCTAQQQYYVLDAGSIRGTVRDMVATYGHCLLGRVTQVYPNYCYLQLITDQQNKIPAICARSESHGIIQGNNNQEVFDLVYISHLEPLQEHELVLTSGDGLIYPRGLGIGKISAFTKDLNSFYYHIQVEPLIDFSKIRYCTLQKKITEQARIETPL
jgi:rod shape-determining protein MreC